MTCVTKALGGLERGHCKLDYCLPIASSSFDWRNAIGSTIDFAAKENIIGTSNFEKAMTMSDETQTARSAPASISERTCVHPGCGGWGCFGLERSREGPSYWCKEHLPADYWTPRLVN